MSLTPKSPQSQSSAQSALTIIVDTREQLPYKFAPPNSPLLATTRRKLDTGDYSIVGHTTRITIERKTLADAHSSLGGGHKRFARELERMSMIRFAYIVFECTLAELATTPFYGTANAKAMTAALVSMCVKYQIAPLWAGNAQFGEAMTSKLLTAYWKYHGDKEGAT